MEIQTHSYRVNRFLMWIPKIDHRERTSLFDKWHWANWMPACERVKLDLISHHMQKLTENRLTI